MELWDSKLLPCQFSLTPCIFARMHTVASTHTSSLHSVVNIMCILSSLHENKGRGTFPCPRLIPYFGTFHRFCQTPFFLLSCSLFIYAPWNFIPFCTSGSSLLVLSTTVFFPGPLQPIVPLHTPQVIFSL